MSAKSTGKKLNPKTNWKRFSKMKDSEINAGIAADPEARDTDPKFWERARVVMPKNKEIVTMRLDKDLLHWFRKEKGYQTLINAVLRSYMQAHQK